MNTAAILSTNTPGQVLPARELTAFTPAEYVSPIKTQPAGPPARR